MNIFTLVPLSIFILNLLNLLIMFFASYIFNFTIFDISIKNLAIVMFNNTLILGGYLLVRERTFRYRLYLLPNNVKKIINICLITVCLTYGAIALQNTEAALQKTQGFIQYVFVYLLPCIIVTSHFSTLFKIIVIIGMVIVIGSKYPAAILLLYWMIFGERGWTRKFALLISMIFILPLINFIRFGIMPSLENVISGPVFLLQRFHTFYLQTQIVGVIDYGLFEFLGKFLPWAENKPNGGESRFFSELIGMPDALFSFGVATGALQGNIFLGAILSLCIGLFFGLVVKRFPIGERKQWFLVSIPIQLFISSSLIWTTFYLIPMCTVFLLTVEMVRSR